MVFANLFYWRTNQYVIQRNLAAKAVKGKRRAVFRVLQSHGAIFDDAARRHRCNYMAGRMNPAALHPLI